MKFLITSLIALMLGTVVPAFADHHEGHGDKCTCDKECAKKCEKKQDKDCKCKKCEASGGKSCKGHDHAKSTDTKTDTTSEAVPEKK